MGGPRLDLASALTALQWKWKRRDASTLESLHSTPEGPLRVFVREDAHWIIASVVPFLRTRGQHSLELSRWLLRMNRDMRWAKFAYDEDGDVVLEAELMREATDEAELSRMLANLVDTAIVHRRTLRIAAG
jgi:Putative bacterial sensory transduction regulator